MQKVDAFESARMLKKVGAVIVAIQLFIVNRYGFKQDVILAGMSLLMNAGSAITHASSVRYMTERGVLLVGLELTWLKVENACQLVQPTHSRIII
jgi:hypothetical protein